MTIRRLETPIERSFVRRAEALGCKTLKLNVHGRRGWPDRLVLMPNGRKELFEFKRKGKRKLDPLQDAIRDDLNAMGHGVYVFDDADTAIAFLVQILKPNLE